MIPAILQARMKSARLPGKVLMPVVGRAMISLNIERIRQARTVQTLVVATSDAPEDDALASLCAGEGVPVFRGSEEDVLDRIHRCAAEYGWPVFGKFTADNPLIDPAVIDRVIDAFLAAPDQYDYVSNNHPPTWQDGQEVEVIRSAALAQAWREGTQSFQREHVTPFIWDQPERYRLSNVARDDDAWYRRYRWTLDYPEDYLFVKAVYEHLYPAKAAFDTADVMALLEARPAIAALNSNRHGNLWYDQHPGALRTI
jgi:spore coat polysaccharide biosynthesis protein SpsF